MGSDLKNDMEKIREEFKNDLHEIKDELQKLNDKLDHSCATNSMDGEISTNIKNAKIDAYSENDMESDQKQIKVLRKAFGEEKKYIRRYKTHIDKTLKEYMEFVDASLKSNQKHLLSILNETSMQVIEFQSEQLEEIKENQITFQFMLDEILVNLTENDINIHEVKQAQSELAQQLGQHVAFNNNNNNNNNNRLYLKRVTHLVTKLIFHEAL